MLAPDPPVSLRGGYPTPFPSLRHLDLSTSPLRPPVQIPGYATVYNKEYLQR